MLDDPFVLRCANDQILTSELSADIVRDVTRVCFMRLTKALLR
jgi:hypothetical protein